MSKDNLSLKDTPLIHTTLGSWNDSGPTEEVVIGGGEADGTEVFFLEVGDLSVYAFESGLWSDGKHREGSTLTSTHS